MRLSYLQVQGFRCFAEVQRIDFPATGIIAIVGERPDGGSSGAGKSSVLQAIAYGMGFSTFPASKQQSWLTKTPLQVDLGLVTEDGSEELRISRGKKTEVVLNGKQVAKGATEVNKWLSTYFDMDPELQRRLTFRPQRKGGLFMGMTAGEKRVFMAAVLGFKRFEELADTLGKEATELAKNLAIQEALLRSTPLPPVPEAAVQTLRWDDEYFQGFISVAAPDYTLHRQAELNLDAAGERVATLMRADVQSLEALQAQLTNELEALDIGMREELATVEYAQPQLPHTEALKLNEERRQKLNEKKKLLAQREQAERDTLRTIEKQRLQLHSGFSAHKDIERYNQQLESMAGSKCYTCGQHWSDQQAYLVAIAGLAEAQERMQAFTEANAKLIANIHDIEQSLKTYRPQIEKCDEGLRILEEQRQRWLQERREVEHSYGRELAAKQLAVTEKWTTLREQAHQNVGAQMQEISGRIADAKLAIQKLQAKKADVYAKLDLLQERIRAEVRRNATLEQMRANYDGAVLRIRDIELKVRQLQSELEEKQDLQAATRAFLGAISEEVLAEIREEANAMLAALPNVKGVGIRFTTETLAESGMRQEIRTVLTYGAEDDIDAESQLSGGQLTSVELAVDRAVSKVLRRRRGGYRLPSWMALDESFDGHDLPTKEACIDFLRTDVGASQVFIIDHASEMREAFEHKILVRGDTGGSKISMAV
jgi:hypothetical protein